MILIVADESDPHAVHVSRLVAEAGGSAVVLDFAKVTQRLTLCHAPDGRRSMAHLGGDVDISVDDVEAVWLRRPEMMTVPRTVTDDTARTFIRHEWSAALNGALLTNDAIRWVNDPFAQNAAGKPLQLHCARRVGLAVPDTIVTNDPARVREFVRRHDGQVVHKALTDPIDRLVDTRAWDQDRDDPWLDETLGLAPCIFQQRVRGPGDVRVVIVGSQLLAVFVDARSSRSVVDSRLDLDAASRPYELPAPTRQLLLDLMSRLGLVFGVADLKIDESGRHVFLEVNPQGQFLFMEILARLPISAAVARFLLHGDGG